MDFKSFSKQLETIAAITITPFDSKTKEINWEGVRENINFLVNNGVKVIVPCGNTSEFYALTLDEAKEEIKRTVEIVNGRALVVAGIGYSLKTAIELGKYAEEVGADCVMIHQPIHPFVTNEGVLSYYQQIIDAVNIPSIVYWKDPSLSDDVLKQLAHCERIVGVKYAINDLPRFAKLVQEVPNHHNITWICGTAEKWAPFFYFAGAKGFTSGLINVAPQKSFDMLHALQNNDQFKVWEVWRETLRFENLRAKYNNGNNVVVVKEAMAQIGLKSGVTREPVNPLSEEDRRQVIEILKMWDLQKLKR
ncbi:4-hydroxy-tetrahydrodipicolinate synthase [Caldalkalibacillus uzonensis]|uniref:4-hydroxy-tetrahydrodipicolinate synthase n=1 Tax=Caldalkalibacillus uzonensis TaxID=353224 RepID=A0ABU0CST7_9BACI|nr:dihydrodipicolinate synthase family protein [Caldalkalibacillus uzonensis]MDQ0338102.1 4-hydroxy-tetrahydrodipicolinate synthase [Caldalkalibacillus uzonensis]